MRTTSFASSLCLLLSLLTACVGSPQPQPLQLVQSRPQNVSPTHQALIDVANQYARDGLYREAIASFKKYLAEQPKDAAAHRTLGIIYVKSGAYKQAIVHLQEALPLYPDNFELNYYLAEAYRTQNRYADAIYHYKRALNTDPKNLPTLKALTWSYYSIRYYTEALKASKALRKMDPNDFQISIIQARIMNKIGMNDKALTVLNKAEALASPEEVPYLYSVKGDIYLELGEKDKAEQSFRRALQDQPLLPGALTGLAKKLLTDGKNTDQAIIYLERAIRIRPQHLEAYFHLGRAYEKLDPKKSEDFYKQFYKEAAFDPSFQQEVASLRIRFANEEKKSKSDTESVQSSRAEELEDQL